MASRTIEKGARTYLAKRIITATEATAAITVTASGITDPLACGIRAAAMEVGSTASSP
jgi:hypothetical protein